MRTQVTLGADIATSAGEAMNRLSPKQRKIARASTRNLLVLAPAGTGKTAVLAARYISLVASGVETDQILAVTFSRRAAEEMRDRIRIATQGVPESRIYVDTTHALGLRILRAEGRQIGIDDDARLIEQEEASALMAEAVLSIRPDSDRADHLPERVREYLDLSSLIKSSGLTPSMLSPSSVLPGGRRLTPSDILIVEQYARLLRTERLFEYDDLLSGPLQIFRARPEVARKWASAFSHVIVDEVQDLNAAQSEMIRILAAHAKVLLLGDDDQQIYSWRGASGDLVRNFQAYWPDGIRTTLEENYRCGARILAHAENLINCNRDRVAKKMVAHTQNSGDIYHLQVPTTREEIRSIIDIVRDRNAQGVLPGRIAILTRSRAEASEIAFALIGAGLPVWSPHLDVLRAPQTREILSWARIATGRSDQAAIHALMRSYTAGIPPHVITRLIQTSRSEQRSFWDVLESWESQGLVKPDGPTGQFMARVRKVRSIKSSGVRAIRQIAHIIGFRDDDPSPASSIRSIRRDASNRFRINDLCDAMIALGASEDDEETDLGAMLDALNLAMRSNADRPDQASKIRVDTMHSAKGIEFDTVITTGWEEGNFPKDNSSPEAVEEDRRTAYVTVTRARAYIAIISVSNRHGQRGRQPSRFIGEMGLQILEASDACP